MENYMTGKTLAEKQMFYYNGELCPYCNQRTELVDSGIVYQESHGMIYYCKPCGAWVGTKFGDQALGPLAKKGLRNLRIELHELFNKLIAIKMARGEKKIAVQKKIYGWMAEVLKIDRAESHIGYLGEDACKIMIEEANKLFLTPEQKQEKLLLISRRIDVVNFQAGFIGFDAKHFKVGALNKMELYHPTSGKIFDYFPETNTGYWQGKKKNTPLPVDDIEEFIEEHFKPKTHA
jgi:hypothetical protein